MLLILFVLSCLLSSSYGVRSTRPNILFIMADDLGWADVGWNDPGMYTPVLDDLAQRGVVMNQTYMQVKHTNSHKILYNILIHPRNAT